MSKPYRIAIADDHKLVRSGISMILNSHPDFVVVQEAENGQELIEQLPVSKPDLVLLDLEMPVLGGKETLIEIRKEFAALPVVVLTMHNNTAFILQMMELGANGYLLKDAEPATVIEAILKVKSSGFYFSDAVSLAMLQGISEGQSRPESKLPGHELTKRELDVLVLICQELTTKEIGDRLFVSPKTVEGYRKVLMEKSGARNMAGLVLYAVKHRLI